MAQKIPAKLIAAERSLLARLLCAAPPGTTPRRRKLALRKVSKTVERTWVSASCFGEAVQWRLKEKPK